MTYDSELKGLVRSKMSTARMAGLIIGAIFFLATVLLIPALVEDLEAKNVMVIQSVTGELKCYTEPGPVPQLFGTYTKYPRRSTYEFDTLEMDATGKVVVKDTGKPLQFNDGGKGTVYGSINWEMPNDCKQIIEVHKIFGSPEGVEAQGVSRMVNSAVYLSGTNMSSTESSAERRGELLELINDQAQNGVYQTVTKIIERKDTASGEVRQVSMVEIVRDANGKPKRQQGSILEQYGIQLQPMSIERLVYSTEVEDQIRKRQDAVQQVQLAQANARKAEQDALTVEAQGRATAAKAKWEQETVKAKEVTLAQQKLEVATLAAKEAEQFKREQILRGEGEAARKQLVMEADGALDQKLEAYKEVQARWADAFAKYTGPMVPSVQFGADGGAHNGAGSNAAGSAQQLVNLLTAKTARDLSLDLTVTNNKPAKK